MSRINLSEWLDSRGIFKDVEFGDVELQIVSLSKDLIEQLKVLPTHAMMIDFVAESGLAHNRIRILDDTDKSEDLPIIWDMPQFKEAKSDIVGAICELSDIGNILTEKEEEEELAAIEKEEKEKADKVLNGDDAMPLDVDMGTIEAEYNAHNNPQ